MLGRLEEDEPYMGANGTIGTGPRRLGKTCWWPMPQSVYHNK